MNNAHLQRHIRVVHCAAQTIELIPCKYGAPCTRSYKSKEKMLIHYQKVHVDQTDIKSLSFSCDLCSAVFRRKAQHRQHMFSHTNKHPYTCQHCQRGFMNRYNLRRHENSHRIYNCADCDEKFLKWSLLVGHRHNAHTNNEFKCAECGRQFQSKRGLKHHRIVHEEKDDRVILQCPHDKCPSYFFHQRNLNAHIRAKHEGIKFICDFGGCGKTLCTKQKLQLHMNAVHLKCKKTAPAEGASVGVERKPRKDKGIPKESMAAKLAQIHMPKIVDQMVMAGKGHQIQFDYNDDDIRIDTVEVGIEPLNKLEFGTLLMTTS